MAAVAAQRGYQRVLLVALAPHLPRVTRHWRDANASLTTHGIGVAGPFRYRAWEWVMTPLETVLPPGSRARQLLFELTGRRR
jgi:hypothetical protein